MLALTRFSETLYLVVAKHFFYSAYKPPCLYFNGGGLQYIKGGDAPRGISNEPLKGTNLGVA